MLRFIYVVLSLPLTGLEAFPDEHGYLPRIRYILQHKDDVPKQTQDNKSVDENNNAELSESESSDSDSAVAAEQSKSKSL